jgi:hypothetical protein
VRESAVSGEARLVRDLNDRVYALLRDIAAPEGAFVCECDDPDCERSVALTIREYAAIRARGRVRAHQGR